MKCQAVAKSTGLKCKRIAKNDTHLCSSHKTVKKKFSIQEKRALICIFFLLVPTLAVYMFHSKLSEYYTIPSALLFIILPIFMTIISFAGLTYFQRIEFYKIGYWKEVWSANAFSLFILFFAYMLLIEMLSVFSFGAFQTFITPKTTTFHPEVLVYVIPALFGGLLFIMRKLPSKEEWMDISEELFLDRSKDKKRLLQVRAFPHIGEIASMDLYLCRVKEGIYGLVSGIFVIGTIGFVIFSVNVFELAGINQNRLLNISAIFALIFLVIDFILSYWLSNKEVDVSLLYVSEKKQPEKILWIEKYPRIKSLLPLIGKVVSVLFVLLILGLFSMMGMTYYKNKDIPIVNRSMIIDGYEITFSINTTPKGEEMTSEKIKILQNESFEYHTSIVRIRNGTYPVSTKIKKLLQKDIIKAEYTGEYLNKKIAVVPINITMQRRNNTPLTPPTNIYYFTTEYDDYIFLELARLNFTNFTSVALDKAPNSPTLHIFQKVLFAQNKNESFSIYMEISQDGAFILKDIYFFSNNTELMQNIKNKIKSFEDDVSIHLVNNTVSSEQLLTFR